MSDDEGPKVKIEKKKTTAKTLVIDANDVLKQAHKFAMSMIDREVPVPIILAAMRDACNDIRTICHEKCEDDAERRKFDLEVELILCMFNGKREAGELIVEELRRLDAEREKGHR